MLWGRCGFCNERIYQFDLIFTFALRAGEVGGGETQIAFCFLRGLIENESIFGAKCVLVEKV